MRSFTNKVYEVAKQTISNKKKNGRKLSQSEEEGFVESLPRIMKRTLSSSISIFTISKRKLQETWS
jgi:hypothetical protein